MHSKVMRQRAPQCERRKHVHQDLSASLNPYHMVQDAEGATQSADGARLRDVVARCAAMGSERPRAAYATRNLEQARSARLPLPAILCNGGWQEVSHGMCRHAADSRCPSCVLSRSVRDI